MRFTPKARRYQQRRGNLDFSAISELALDNALLLLRRWLPDGTVKGDEYIALNPRRADRKVGSFKINLTSGHWADFAVANARGRDLISLAAYVYGMRNGDAARLIRRTLGLGGNHG